MKTDNLISALVADLAISSMRLQRTFALALVMGSVLAAAMFFLWIGFRPDIAQALETVRFPFKFVVTLSLAATATGFLVRLARPGVSPGLWRCAWLVAPLLLASAVVTELAVMPAATWWLRLVGSNGRACLTLIPLLSIGPLACTLLALRHGAPTRPGLAGAVAGLVASGIAATFYASNCTPARSHYPVVPLDQSALRDRAPNERPASFQCASGPLLGAVRRRRWSAAIRDRGR